MEEVEKLEVPTCKKCKSRQIRTTKTYRICVRCGYKEQLE